MLIYSVEVIHYWEYIVNPQGKYDTPLIAACERGLVSVVEKLVKVGLMLIYRVNIIHH
jgi:hypothetical protein